MVAEPQEPSEHIEPKKEGKPSILAYIGKEKRKERNLPATIRLTSKESKRETTFLYMQFELIEPIKVPREEDRLNFIALVYLLAKQLIAVGITPDLAFTSIVRDSEKKVKFLRKSDRGTEFFHKQLLELFMYIVTGFVKQEEQLKAIRQVAELPE